MSLTPWGQRLRIRRYPRACRLARIVWPAAPYRKFCADPPADRNQTNGDHGGDQDNLQLYGHVRLLRWPTLDNTEDNADARHLIVSNRTLLVRSASR
jgi:hypothetical protein